MFKYLQMKKWVIAVVLLLLGGVLFYFKTSCNQKIDVVYTWVDGSDPVWQEKKNARARECHREIVTYDANSANRYRNRDELKYSLRALHEYAPFVNHIYIVTCGQKPAWIQDHPKITFVSHEDIFTDPKHLPTFNSQAIEAHLHRIPNLQEHYLYLNDDFIFTSRVEPRDFFTRDGKPKVFFDKSEVVPYVAREDGKPLTAYHVSMLRTAEWVNQQFGKQVVFHMKHAPYVMKKSIVHEFESQYPDILQVTSSHPFRSSDDYTLTNGVIPYFALYHNMAAAGSIHSKILYIKDDYERNFIRLDRMYLPKVKMICVEDEVIEGSDKIDQQVVDALEKKFPKKAPWET